MRDYSVMVVVAGQRWTAKAMHLACAMARSNKGQVKLVKMVAAGHPALLGSPEGSRNLTEEDGLVLLELANTAERYGVPVEITICQFANYNHALVDAAEQLDVAAVFAPLPHSHIPVWSRFQHWRLEHDLARDGRTLHTLEQSGGPLEWTPSATQTFQPHSSSGGNESKV